MKQKEFVGLIEDNIRVLGWLNARVMGDNDFAKYSNQYLKTIVRLHITGRALLKDIAKRNDMSPSNLCATLKNLEKDGLVLRQIDDSDRRNTWYSLSKKGDAVARDALNVLRQRITELFAGLNKGDEVRLTSALRTMNELLNKIRLCRENTAGFAAGDLKQEQGFSRRPKGVRVKSPAAASIRLAVSHAASPDLLASNDFPSHKSRGIFSTQSKTSHN